MNKYRTIEWEDKIRNACKKELTMAKACASIKMNKNTFRTHAKRLGVYNPNQSGKGIKRNGVTKYKLEDILLGKYPQFQSSGLRKRLISEGIKEHKCEDCDNTKWAKQLIPLELHHIDGDHHNHLEKNLKLLCPNCHAITSNYGSKNWKN